MTTADQPVTGDTAPTAAKPGPDAAGFDSLAATRELVTMVADEVGCLPGQMCADDKDESSVGTQDGKPLPMTFGHVRRALSELNIPDAPTSRDPVTRPDGGEDDAAFVERMARSVAHDPDGKLVGSISLSTQDQSRLIQIARRGASAPAAGAVAWSYELAYSRNRETGKYSNWGDAKVSFGKPNVPEGAIRNLTPLFTHPQAAPAATGAVTDEMIDAACNGFLSGYSDGLSRQECLARAKEAALAATLAGLMADGSWRFANAPIASLSDGEQSPRSVETDQNAISNASGASLAATPAGSTPDGGCTSVVTSGDTDDATDLYEEVVDACGFYGATDAQAIARRVLDRRRTASPQACAEPVTDVEYRQRVAAREAIAALQQRASQAGLTASADGMALVALEAARTATATPAPGQTDGRRGS